MTDLIDHGEFVSHHGLRTMVIHTVAAKRERLPISGMVVQVGHKGLLKRRKKRLEFLFVNPIIVCKIPARVMISSWFGIGTSRTR